MRWELSNYRLLIRYATNRSINSEVTSSNPGVSSAAAVAAVTTSFSSDEGVRAGFGLGVVVGTGVGVEIGVVVMLSTGVGVAVGTGVTFHIQVCRSYNSAIALVAITETFQVPATALVFV